MSDTLQRTLAVIQADPRGAEGLLLYALVSTLRMEKSGYLFILRKLRDLSPANRQLAYGLMELMARGGNEGDGWEQAVAAMDAAVRGGQGFPV